MVGAKKPLAHILIWLFVANKGGCRDFCCRNTLQMGCAHIAHHYLTDEAPNRRSLFIFVENLVSLAAMWLLANRYRVVHGMILVYPKMYVKA